MGTSKSRSGFTLIELITLMAIVGIIGVISLSGLGRSFESYIMVAEETQLSAETWLAVERIGRELRHAASVSVPPQGETSSTLSFTRATACSTCQDSSIDIGFTFTPADGKLWRSSGASGTRVIAENVASFSVAASAETIDRRVYAISLTLRSDKSGREVTVETAARAYAATESSWTEIIQ